MKIPPLRTSVVGSYPFPGWLEFGMAHADRFGPEDREEMIDDAVAAAVRDQVEAGLDVITDGEQTRADFNLSFYSFLDGIDREELPRRRFGPPAHDQRGRHRILGELRAPNGLGAVAEFRRLQRIAPAHQPLKASLPGPYTLSGRLIPAGPYPDRFAVAEALVPEVRRELEALADAGCEEICVDEPSMSCYAHREDPERLVDLFNRTVATIADRVRLSTHLCFGNFRARAVAPRRYAPMFPAFLGLRVEEIHVEMAGREFSELELIGTISTTKSVAVGIVDVKSYWIEPVEEIQRRVHRCLAFAPAQRLSFAPDCGLSQTARWAARLKLKNLVEGVKRVRNELAL